MAIEMFNIESYRRKLKPVNSMAHVTRFKFDYVIDIDNTLLDGLGALEKRFKGYTRDLQESYSFNTPEIVSSVKNAPHCIYNVFNKPTYFLACKGTNLLKRLSYLPNVIGEDSVNILIYSHEPSSVCFKAKVQRLYELLPRLRYMRVWFMRYDNQESKERVLDLLLTHCRVKEVWDDHPISIKLVTRKGLKLRAIGYKYVRNAVDELDDEQKQGVVLYEC